MDKIYTARRKSAICRLKVKEVGNGMKVNNLDFNKYFYESRVCYYDQVMKLLDVFSLGKSFSFSCRLHGGGKSAQCSSVMYAIAKALKAKFNDEFIDDQSTKEKMNNLLRKTGYLSVDMRKVEPKKYGRRKARATEQFVRR